jgi:hypothetical protein
MAALHGPLATSKGYGCSVRMRYGLADTEVAAVEVMTPPLWSA